MESRRRVRDDRGRGWGDLQKVVSMALLAGTRLRFFEDGNLSSVVEFMLRDSVQHEIEIVFLARNALAQARVGQGRYSFHQHIVRALGLSDGSAPGGFGGAWDDRGIGGAPKLDPLSPPPAATCRGPSRDAQHHVPPAVRFVYRLCRTAPAGPTVDQPP